MLYGLNWTFWEWILAILIAAALFLWGDYRIANIAGEIKEAGGNWKYREYERVATKKAIEVRDERVNAQAKNLEGQANRIVSLRTTQRELIDENKRLREALENCQVKAKGRKK